MHTTFKPADLASALDMIDVHKAKASKAMADQNWAGARSALRAMQEDCEHAQRIAQELNTAVHVQQQGVARFIRCAGGIGQ